MIARFGRLNCTLVVQKRRRATCNLLSGQKTHQAEVAYLKNEAIGLAEWPLKRHFKEASRGDAASLEIACGSGAGLVKKRLLAQNAARRSSL